MLDGGFKCVSTNRSRLQMAASFHTKFDLLVDSFAVKLAAIKHNFTPENLAFFPLLGSSGSLVPLASV